MPEHEDLPYIVIERRSGGAMPFLWGALIGAGAALLFAPRSGEETQEELRRNVDRVRTAAEERVTSTRDAVMGAVDQARDRARAQVEMVRDTVNERTQQAREAMDAGRQAASDTRAELERRVSEAKSAPAPQPDPRTTSGFNAPGEPVADVVITEVYVEEGLPRADQV